MNIPNVRSLPAAPILGVDTNEVFSNKVDALFGELPGWTDDLNAAFVALLAAVSTSNYSATSTTELTIGTGPHSLTIDAGKQIMAGTPLLIADFANPTVNWMFGQATSYNFTTGALGFQCLRKLGTGTISAWAISLSGPQGIGGDTLPDFTGNLGKYLGVAATEDESEWKAFLPNTALLGTLTPTAETEFIFTGDWSNYENLTLEIDGTFSNASGSSKNFTVYAASNGVVWSTGQLLFSSNTALTLKSLMKFLHINANGGVWLGSPNVAGSGDTLDLSSGFARGWRIAGGIRKLRLLVETGATFTGTIKLYGDKINGQV